MQLVITPKLMNFIGINLLNRLAKLRDLLLNSENKQDRSSPTNAYKMHCFKTVLAAQVKLSGLFKGYSSVSLRPRICTGTKIW